MEQPGESSLRSGATGKSKERLTAQTTGRARTTVASSVPDLPSLALLLGQLNDLLDQHKFADYWQQGVATIRSMVGAHAISLRLMEFQTGEGVLCYRTPSLPPAIAARVDELEAAASMQMTLRMMPAAVARQPQVTMDDDLALLTFPLTVDRMVRGTVTMAIAVSALPAPAQVTMLTSMIQSFGAAGIRAQQLVHTRFQLDRVNIIYQTTQAISSSLELRTVFNQTTELAASILHAEAASLFVVDEERGELVFLVARGAAASSLEEMRIPLSAGVVGWVVSNGRPLIVNDTTASELFDSTVDIKTGFNTRNILCVPLRVKERVIGVLELMNKHEPGGFSLADAEWLATMGQQVAIALENANLFAREQAKVRELALLNEVSTGVNSSLGADAVLRAITDGVLEMTRADRSELWLGDGRRPLRLFASAGFRAAAAHDAVPAAPADGIVQWAASNASSVAVLHASSDERHVSRPDFVELDDAGVIAVPLIFRERVAGVIAVYAWGRHSFADEQLDLLRAFANQAANALHNAELYESLRLEQERIIRAQEEVRHHLARDLHDNTAQMLSLIIMNIDMLRQQVQNGRTARLLPDLEGLEKIARQTNREVRTLLFELRPIILETRGLIPALVSYHRQLEQSMECTLHLDVEELPFQIELTAASAIFSVMQEAVNNIRKHAHAQNIWMRVRCVDNTLHFAVEDDGRGFDIDRVLTSYDERGSMGLLDMHERVSMLNGRLTVTSPRIGHGTGTIVSGQLPLDRLKQAGSESAHAKSVFGAFVNN